MMMMMMMMMMIIIIIIPIYISRTVSSVEIMQPDFCMNFCCRVEPITYTLLCFVIKRKNGLSFVFIKELVQSRVQDRGAGKVL
jgi:hypothetical protein